jgi:hypothetical protein
MTMKEIAAAQAAAAADAQKKTPPLVLGVLHAVPSRPRELPTRPERPPSHQLPCEDDRLLATENLTDVIPNFPPRSSDGEKLWNQACLLPHSNLGIIMAHSSQTAWIACCRIGKPPLLLFPLPMLGRLPEIPLDPLLPLEQ